MSDGTKAEAPEIGIDGFKVVGADHGGWIVLSPRTEYGPIVAWKAFSTFAELMQWLGTVKRVSL